MLSLFFFNDTATTEIYTLSLHDALPISGLGEADAPLVSRDGTIAVARIPLSVERSDLVPVETGERLIALAERASRSEEHTSELQSRQYLVCRLLLEKKNKTTCIKFTYKH